MITVIDRRRQLLVDRSSGAEIKGAESADIEAGDVEVREMTYSGELRRTVHFPAGVALVQRY